MSQKAIIENYEIVKEGEATIEYTAGNQQALVTVAHNLNYLPVLMAYVELDGEYYPLSHTDVQTSGADSGAVKRHISAIVDSTSAIFIVYIADFSSLYSSDESYTIKYYLFRENI